MQQAVQCLLPRAVIGAGVFGDPERGVDRRQYLMGRQVGQVVEAQPLRRHVGGADIHHLATGIGGDAGFLPVGRKIQPRNIEAVRRRRSRSRSRNAVGHGAAAAGIGIGVCDALGAVIGRAPGLVRRIARPVAPVDIDAGGSDVLQVDRQVECTGRSPDIVGCGRGPVVHKAGARLIPETRNHGIGIE